MNKYFCVAFLCLLSAYGQAQNRSKIKTNYNSLYQYGIAESFLGGLFRGGLPVSELKKNGNFGIAAPNLVDGEVIMYQGKVYQTRSNGKTTLMSDTARVPLAFVCFFKPDTSFRISQALSQKQLEEQIEHYLKNKNGVYAIRISGLFDRIKTRAFYPVTTEPFPPIASLIAGQKTFEMAQQQGTIFGYKVPPYLKGLNIAGYHFHFLANDFEKGGHVLDFLVKDAVVEIALMKALKLQIPNDKTFADYQFKNEQ